MITPEKIVASCNSPSRVADELNDAVRLVRENVGPAESLVFHVDDLSRLDGLDRQFGGWGRVGVERSFMLMRVLKAMLSLPMSWNR